VNFNNERQFVLDLDQIGLNLSGSSRSLVGAESMISLNMDYSDESGALTGRYGTTTVDGKSPFPGPVYELYMAYNNLAKYIIAVCLASYVASPESGVQKLYIKKEGTIGWYAMQDITGLADFTLPFTGNRPRVSFTTAHNPALGKVVVSGTDGVNEPFYWDFTITAGPIYRDVTTFHFGTGHLRIHHFVPMPHGDQGAGRLWAFFRIANMVELHGSDPNDHRKWVDEGDAIFFQVPQEDFSNPLRAILPIRDQFIAFNLNSINAIYYTGNANRPFNYSMITGDAGTLTNRSLCYWQGNIIFIDKREPYLFLFDGAQVHPLDPEHKLTKGVEQNVDWLDAANVTLCMSGDNLLVNLKQKVYAPGSVAKRCLLVINMGRLNRRGIAHYPASLWSIPANDIINAAGSTDIGQVYYSDNEANYVRRIMDRYDARITATPPFYPFGDNNGVGDDDQHKVGTARQDVTYRLRTGEFDMGFPGLKKVLMARLEADWEGIPTHLHDCHMKYAFNGWTTWNQIKFKAIKEIDWVPLAANAYGSTMQVELYWKTDTARPILKKLLFSFVPYDIRRMNR